MKWSYCLDAQSNLGYCIILYCVSLIMVIITRHVFVNIFQTEHFSAVKFGIGYKRKTIWVFLWHQNHQKLDKKLEKNGLCSFNICCCFNSYIQVIKIAVNSFSLYLSHRVQAHTFFMQYFNPKRARGRNLPPPFDIFCYISAGCYFFALKLLDFFPSSLALDLRPFL